MENIENVVFDLGGVLVDLDIDRCRASFRRLGMDAVAELINPCYPAEMIGRLEHGLIPFHEMCDEMRRLASTPNVSDEEIGRAYGDFLTGVPVAKMRQIEGLRRRGIRKMIADSGMVPERTLFIDDGQKNVDAAQALGFAVYKPAPGEDFGHLLDSIGRK